MVNRRVLWAPVLWALLCVSNAWAEQQDSSPNPPPEEEPAPWGAPPTEPEPEPEPEQWGPPPEQGPLPPVEPDPPQPDAAPPEDQPQVIHDPQPEPEPPDTEPLPELESPVQQSSDGSNIRHGFGFGSYGRVSAGTDLQGSTARPISVVAHAPRVVESPYLELDLYYDMTSRDGWNIRTITTLAFLEDFFHYTGDFSSMLALRNAYAEFSYNNTFTVWAGSRMYRGDDIYLLDYWPLDNLNTVGGGLGLRLGRFEAQLHSGVNRLTDDFQFQEVLVPGRLFGAEQVVYMDRQRFITSLGLSYRLFGPPEGPAIKAKVYFELHGLPSGTMRREDQSTEDLPSDFGWVGGLQLGAWGFGERLSHANLFLRFGQGLGAFNEMAIPFGLNADKRTFPHASELVLGASVNYERGIFGVLGAGYVRRFVDADRSVHDTDDGWELVLDARPYIVIWGPLQFQIDISYQQRFPTGMSPTALELLRPAVFQVAPMLVFAPLGPGSYERPHIRFVYRYAHLNDGALDLYAAQDPRHDQPNVHYLGVQVEWWFNSSYR